MIELIQERDKLKAEVAFWNVNTDKRQERVNRIAEIDRLLQAREPPIERFKESPLY